MLAADGFAMLKTNTLYKGNPDDNAFMESFYNG